MDQVPPEDIHKEDVGEPWHPEYDRTGAQPTLERLEAQLERAITRQFQEILNEMEARLTLPAAGIELKQNLSKADPLPGFILAFLDDELWWSIWRADLARLLQERLLAAAQSGSGSAGRQLNIKLNWRLILPTARQWVEQHTANLVRTVEASLKPVIRQAVLDGLQEGLPWFEVRDRISRETGADSYRAGRIARTEIIRAHAQGAVEGYKASGTVRGLRWLDGQVGACPKCRELHNKMIALGQRFYMDTFGDGLPPRHPNCRCSVAPVTLEQIKRLPLDHPLRENRRSSIAELTDPETFTEIGGVRITGERRRHWTYQHNEHFNVSQAEAMLPDLLNRPLKIKQRGGPVYVMEYNEKNYLIAPVNRKGEILSLYIKTKRKVDKWPEA